MDLFKLKVHHMQSVLQIKHVNIQLVVLIPLYLPLYLPTVNLPTSRQTHCSAYHLVNIPSHNNIPLFNA